MIFLCISFYFLNTAQQSRSLNTKSAVKTGIAETQLLGTRGYKPVKNNFNEPIT